MLAGNRDDLLGHLANQTFLIGILHVDRRPHMEYASIDVTEHAVGEAASVQGGTELGNVIGKVLRGDGRVLDKRDRPPIALHIAEQADRLLAHRPDAPDVLVAARHREAAAAIAGPRRGKHFGNLPERRRDLALGIAGEFDQVDTGGGLAVVVRQECPHVLPDRVALSETEDLGVHGLDRGRTEADQCRASRRAASKLS